MKIYSVFDQKFRSYGSIVSGMEESISQLLEALRFTPLPDEVFYVPEDPSLQELSAAQEISEHLFGGMPVELGWCNGHNTKMNCLEYHRSSEFNLGTEDMVFLLARRDEIEKGTLDTAKVRGFLIPAGVLVEIYATTLHFAPCHTNPEKGFQMLVALPRGTNLEIPVFSSHGGEDALLWARNKWLLAHPESEEAKNGAYIGLQGENIDIASDLSY